MKTITVRVDREILGELDAESRRQMRDRSNLIRVILKEWCDEVKKVRMAREEGDRAGDNNGRAGNAESA